MNTSPPAPITCLSELANLLADIRDLAHSHSLDRVRDRKRVRRPTRGLAEAAGAAQDRVDALLSELSAEPGRSDQAGKSTVVVARTAGRIEMVTARLLPAGERARYAEEFTVELWDLAQAGSGRSRQIGYAIRLLTRAASLRIELKAPRRRKASP